MAAAAARLARKFGRPQPSPASELDKRKNTYSVSEPIAPTASNSAGIYQYGPDYSYFIKVLVGSAKQPFYMLLDTGAANTWLMGSNCESDACKMHNTFDPSSSKSWQKTKDELEINYGTGSLTGVVGHDKASFAGLTPDLSFGLANYTHDDFKHFAFDGILGLGMGDSITGTFLQELKAQKVLDSLVLGISFNRASDGTNDGQVTFGGVDKAKYTGEISYHTIGTEQKEKGEWAVTMDDPSFDGKSAGIGSKLAYIDTGTSFIFAPPAELGPLFNLVPGSSSYKNGDYTEYQVPCDTKLPIVLSFSGVKYEIPAQDWVSRKNETHCISNLYGPRVNINNGAWLVGDTFLKNVYSVFDADEMRVGFAEKAPPPKPTNVAASASATVPAPVKATAVTPTAGEDSAHPVMPGFTGGETAAPGSSHTTTSEPAAAHTQPNAGQRVDGSFYALTLCIAAAVAMLS